MRQLASFVSPSIAGSITMAKLCLLVEDQPRTRDWIVGVLARAFPEMTVATVSSLREARAWLEDYDARHGAGLTLALIDLGLPDGSGIELVRSIAASRPAVLPVVATIYDDDTHVFDAIAAGARGYLLKDEEADQLVSLLRRIEGGEPPLSPSIAHRMLAHFRAAPPPDRAALVPDRAALVPRQDDAGLTARETETLSLIAKGLTIAEAAARMGLKPQTVASYVKTIYEKLNVSTRAEATLAAVRRGLV
jgi:DNA-binding NarL/FixJ family response regulator